MIRTWFTVISMVVLIISGLLFLRSTYNKGYDAGENKQKIIQLEQQNKELGEALKATQENIEQATKFDLENQIRTEQNETALPNVNSPIVNGGNIAEQFFDEQFLAELDKLR